MLVSGAVIIPTIISASVTAKKMSAPTIVTFSVSQLKTCCSIQSKVNIGGNHYGNDKPDQNPIDHKNQYDGVDGFKGGPHDKK